MIKLISVPHDYHKEEEVYANNFLLTSISISVTGRQFYGKTTF